jgi:hypothetical protein
MINSLTRLQHLVVHMDDHPCDTTVVWTLPSLTSVEFTKAHYLPRLDAPLLKRISIFHGEVQRAPSDLDYNLIIGSCHRLTYLDLPPMLPARFLTLKWSSWPLLQSLNLFNTPHVVTHEMIHEIGQSCPRMEVLSISVPQIFVVYPGWLVKILQEWPLTLTDLRVTVPTSIPPVSVGPTHYEQYHFQQYLQQHPHVQQQQPQDMAGQNDLTPPRHGNPPYRGDNYIEDLFDTHPYGRLDRDPDNKRGGGGGDTKSTNHNENVARSANVAPIPSFPSTVPSSSSQSALDGSVSSLSSLKDRGDESKRAMITHPRLGQLTSDVCDTDFLTYYTCPAMMTFAVRAFTVPLEPILHFLSRCPRVAAVSVCGGADVTTAVPLPPVPAGVMSPTETTSSSTIATNTKMAMSLTILRVSSYQMTYESIRALLSSCSRSLTALHIEQAPTAWLQWLVTEPDEHLPLSTLHTLVLPKALISSGEVGVVVAVIRRFPLLRQLGIRSELLDDLRQLVDELPIATLSRRIKISNADL